MQGQGALIDGPSSVLLSSIWFWRQLRARAVGAGGASGCSGTTSGYRSGREQLGALDAEDTSRPKASEAVVVTGSALAGVRRRWGAHEAAVIQR